MICDSIFGPKKRKFYFVESFWSGLAETLSDPLGEMISKFERKGLGRLDYRAEQPDTEDTREAYTILAYCFYWLTVFTFIFFNRLVMS